MSHPKCMRTVRRAVKRNCTNFPGVEKSDARTVSFNPMTFSYVWVLLVSLIIALVFCKPIKFHSHLQSSQGCTQSMRQLSKYNKH